jgi:hypothetical protein
MRDKTDDNKRKQDLRKARKTAKRRLERSPGHLCADDFLRLVNKLYFFSL